MKLSNLLYTIIFYFAINSGINYTLANDDPNPEDDAGAGGDKGPDGNETAVGGEGNGTSPPPPPPTPASDNEKKIIKEGCNFYDKEYMGIKPFSQVQKDDESCKIVLNGEVDAFLYACDGTSEPADCPTSVTTDDGVKKLEGFFTQATVTDEAGSYPENPKIKKVITGKADKPFSASCVCTRANGNKEKMELTSSFKQAGLIGMIGFIVLYLAK